MIRTQISLTDEQMARLRAESLRRGVSIASLIRDAVDTTLRGPDWEARRAAALAAIGSVSAPDGARDVSVRHDEYLAEIYAQ